MAVALALPATAQAGSSTPPAPGAEAPDAEAASSPSPGPPPTEAHLDRARQAALAERDNRPAEAYRACADAIALDPTGPRAERCRRRLVFYEARRDADGTFAAWRTLEALRRTARDRDPEAVRTELTRLVGGEGLAPTTRVEALLWMVQDALNRRHDADEAARLTTGLWAERTTLPPDLVPRVAHAHSVALARAGRTAEAREIEDAAGIRAASTTRATSVDLVVRDARRERLASLTAGLLGAWGLLAAGGLAGRVRAGALRSARRQRLVPLGLIALGLVGAGAWWITAGWADGAGDGVPWMVLGWTGVHLATLGLTTGTPHPGPRARTLAGLGAAVATVCLSYLCLYATSTLDWIGL